MIISLLLDSQQRKSDDKMYVWGYIESESIAFINSLEDEKEDEKDDASDKVKNCIILNSTTINP